MKQVMHFESETEVSERAQSDLEALLKKIETSEHWFDVDTELQHVLTRKPKDLMAAHADDCQVLALLQGRLASLNASGADAEDEDSVDPALA
jgi:hypothetical protein